MKIVGFTGLSRSGKSTAAEMFARSRLETGTGIVMSFAAPFKQMLATLYKINGLSQSAILDRMEGHLKDKPDPQFFDRTPREMMIWLGESGRVKINPDIWVETVRNQIRYAPENSRVAINDVRQHNEARMIHDVGGKIVLIKGRGQHSGHPTDNLPYDMVDMIIHNDGDLTSLEHQVTLI